MLKNKSMPILGLLDSDVNNKLQILNIGNIPLLIPINNIYNRKNYKRKFYYN